MTMTSLSDYNNNPGNLKPPKGVTYEGQIGVDDKGFAVFENKDYGQKALVNDITHKIEKGIDTPEKFVNMFAPAGKENSEDSRDNYKLHLAHQLGLKSTTDPFPKDAHDKIANVISSFEGGTWNQPQQQTTGQVPALPTQGQPLITNAGASPAPVPKPSEFPIPIAAGAGAMLGAGAGATLETGKKVASFAPNLINAIFGRQVAPDEPVSRLSLQRYLNSQIAPNLKLPLSELEQVSGAGKIRTMSEVQNALKAIQAVEDQKTTKPVYRMVSGRPGVFEETGMVTTSTTPGRPAVDLSKYEMKPQGPMRQAVTRQLGNAAEATRAMIPSFARVAGAGLGGATAAISGVEALEMADKLRKAGNPSWVDYARLAVKAGSALGGGLSVVPTGITQALGLGLQVPEMAWSGAEALQKGYKNADKRQIENALSNVDAMGNPTGALP
jgi:hypothetical protein